MSPSAVSAQEQVPVQDMAALQFGAQVAGPAIVNPEEAAPAPVATNLPGQSLYVGELHPDVTEANLFELFSTVGPVASIRVCRDAVTRRSLGYAYVNFHSPFDAERALDMFNYTPIKGRVCRIMWSQRDPSLRKSGVGNIYIKNLDKDIDNKTLHDTFSMFGNILSCKVVQVDGADAPGYGFVHFETAEAAQSAIDNVNGKLIKDKKVFVTHHVSRREREVKAEQQRARFTNIYVKPLGEDATEADLEKMFSGFGEISSLKVAINNETRKCRGFGFVNFKNTEAAQNAVNELNGKEVDGAVMMVTRAQKKAEREQELRRKFEQARQERLSKFTGANLYIKNLDDDFDDERLRQEFSAYGTITSAKVMRDEKGNPRGFGFVCFSSSEEATRAVTEMNGRIIASKPLYIAMAQRKDARRAQLEMQHAQRVQLRMQQQMAGVPNPMMYGPPPMFFPPPAGGMPGQGPRMFPPQMRQPRWNGPMPVPQPQGPMPPAQPQGMPQPMPGMQPFGRFPAPVMPPQFPMNGVPMQQMNRQIRQNNRGFRNGMTGNQQGGRLLPNGAPANGAPHRRFKYGNNARNVPEGADGPLVDNLTAAALANMSVEQQKRTLGERLFPLVHAIDAERASKIVGMLLEIENTEVLRLIESPEELSAKVAEAIDVLAKAT